MERVEVGVLAREPASIPDGVDVRRVCPVCGDRLLVVEVEGRPFADQGRRLAPRIAAVGGLADEDRRGQEVGARREADEIRFAVRGERHPRIGRPVVVPLVCGGAARARAEVRPRLGPGQAAVVRDGRDDTVGAAVIPAVLLEDADNVVRVRRVGGDERLNLGVRVVRARPADHAPGERARPGGEDERSLRVRAGRRRGDQDERSRYGCKDGSPEGPCNMHKTPPCLSPRGAPTPPSFSSVSLLRPRPYVKVRCLAVRSSRVEC